MVPGRRCRTGQGGVREVEAQHNQAGDDPIGEGQLVVGVGTGRADSVTTTAPGRTGRRIAYRLAEQQDPPHWLSAALGAAATGGVLMGHRERGGHLDRRPGEEHRQLRQQQLCGPRAR
jgi:hypothetical protein